ncbi:ATP-binding protein [Bdellovibrio bacteriovorus]|uniref:ATP-binding protein n=1 Tax=Bdellovibrio bacteriovorus TaxID=959 RepID=UPI0035A65CD0
MEDSVFNAQILMMLYFCGAMLCVFFAGACLEYRQNIAVKIYMAIMAMYAGWLVMNLLMVFSSTVETKEVFGRLRFIFITPLPALWIWFAKELFREPQKSPATQGIGWFFIFPVIIAGACLLPQTHQLIMTDVQPFESFGISAIRWKLGWLGQLHILYSYVLLVFIIVLCTRGVRRAGRNKIFYSRLMIFSLSLFVVADVSGILFLPRFRFLGMPILTQIVSAFAFYYILRRQQVVQRLSQRSHRLFEALPTPVLLVDTEQRVALFNTRAAELFNLSISSVGGLLKEILPSSMAGDFPALSQDPVEVSLELRTGKDSATMSGRFFEVTCQPLAEALPTEPGHLIVFNEVTDLKVSTQVNQRLMSLLSHDLLGNLSGMSLLVAHRRQQDWDLLADTARSSMDLVRNILLWTATKGDFYEVSKEPVKIADLIKASVSQVKPALSEKDLTVSGNSLRDEALVNVDLKMFEAILRNLVSNSIKHSPKGSVIEVSSEVRDGEVYLSVIDQGPGFDSERMQKILAHTGSKPSGETTSAAGYGIGLFLVNQFLRLHHGRLEFSSGKSWGGKVTVVFPIEQGK